MHIYTVFSPIEPPVALFFNSKILKNFALLPLMRDKKRGWLYWREYGSLKMLGRKLNIDEFFEPNFIKFDKNLISLKILGRKLNMVEFFELNLIKFNKN
jgi:hypothetical protein